MSTEMLLEAARRIHIIGVGGSGMSALALLLHERGHLVSGSNALATPMTEHLTAAGLTIVLGHDPATVDGVDLVTFSPSVRESNSELRAAREAGITVLRRGAVLAAVVASRRTLAVAGTHGKTTTSSMLASITLHGTKDPSYLIGEPLRATGENAHFGLDDLLVMEADESYGTFTSLAPAIVGITNIEADHLDYYGTEAALISAFEDLVGRATQAAVVWADDAHACAVGAHNNAATVGTSPDHTFVVADISLAKHGASFTLSLPEGEQLRIRLNVGGLHNIANASVAAAMAYLAGLSSSAIVAGLAGFAGVSRRYELRGEVGGVTLIDDYAHLPTEVEATVSAAADSGFTKLIVIFQPHRYTRISTVGNDFAMSFAGADVVIVVPLYAAGEDPIAAVSSLVVSHAVRASATVAQVVDVASLDEAADLAAQLATAGSVVLSLGAGDSTTLPDRIAVRLAGQ